MTLPPGLRDHLAAPALEPLWTMLRARLERNGHAIRGSVVVDLDDDAADRLGGLLGRVVKPSPVSLRLIELDAALRASAAERGLAAVVAELTGAPLRDRPAERATHDADWQATWAQLDDDLASAGLAVDDWTSRWVEWLHRGGVITRLGTERAASRLRTAVAVLRELDLTSPVPAATRTLGQLAGTVTGSAHGLDDGRTVSALVLRAAAIALEVSPPTSSSQRRDLWRRLGVEPDTVSGTVLVWALRPPGADRWSAMMRERADLGLVTHLTTRELRAHDVVLSDKPVHACENPQVLQSLADGGALWPLACFFGNPSFAASTFLKRTSVRYHGDFDWPGIAIARRVLAAGAEPWLMGVADYLAAIERVSVEQRQPLAGPGETTPWAPDLAATMAAANVALHEETIVDVLTGDLQQQSSS